MKAVDIREFGDPAVLQYEDVERPEPTDGEVRVRIHAAGVNPIDCKVRQGILFPVDLPWTPGWDIAGVVDEVGVDVTEFERGDEVYGMLPFPGDGGAYADAVTVPPSELMRKPTALTFKEAAGIPVTALTAWQALQATGVGADRRVHAAAEDGSLRCPVCKAAGAHVIGTASGSNEEYLHDLGVDEFVNYREERFEDVIEPVDAVIDGVGGETFARSLEILREGRIVDLLLGGGLTAEQEAMAAEHNVEAIYTDSSEWEGEWFEEVTELLDHGTIVPTLDTVFPRSEAREAHELSEEGHTRGKIILTVRDR